MTYAREQALSVARPPSARRHRRIARASDRHAVSLVVAGLAILSSLVASDWLAGAGVIVLWLIWFLLSEEGRIPVLPLAVSFQWMQVTCGVYYLALTGRELETHFASDYRPMVMIGLGCVTALAVGLALGLKFVRSAHRSAESSSPVVSWRTLLIAYFVTSFANVGLREIAWLVPGLAQALLALGFVRLGVLFLLYRRSVHPRFRSEWFFGFLFAELVLGFTGYFAGFREPLMLATLALLEVFRPRSPRHWLRLGAVAGLMATTGIMWIGIRAVYRSEIDSGQLSGSRVERLGRVGELSSDWLGSSIDSLVENTDQLVDRLWVVYYPALAVSRVPEVLPHTNGAILQEALIHIVTPRLLFPDKGILPSDSEMVRKYSGIYVAGAEEGTSIAFGYAAESYIDFGLPWMFLPSLLFGIVMGAAYRGVFRVIRAHELAVGLASVVFWISLYLFERSWIKTLGISVTTLIAVGGLVLVVDRMLARRGARRRARPSPAYGYRTAARTR